MGLLIETAESPLFFRGAFLVECGQPGKQFLLALFLILSLGRVGSDWPRLAN